MKLYLDTEFNGFGGSLISMALVSGERPVHEWYEWIAPGDGLRDEAVDPWVKENVFPHLSHGNYRCVSSVEALKLSFHHFIMRFENPQIICDWPADASHFCNMLSGIDYGSSLDFPCRITILKTPPGEPKSKLPHNALEDARALMRWHQSLSNA